MLYIYVHTVNHGSILEGQNDWEMQRSLPRFRLRVAAMPQSHWDEHIVTG